MSCRPGVGVASTVMVDSSLYALDRRRGPFPPLGRDGHIRTVRDRLRSSVATDVHDESISAADTFDQLQGALLWFDVHRRRYVNASVAAQQTAHPAQGLWAGAPIDVALGLRG